MKPKIGDILFVEYPPHGTTGHMLVTEVFEHGVKGIEKGNKWEGQPCWTNMDCIIKKVEESNLVTWLETLNKRK